MRGMTREYSSKVKNAYQSGGLSLLLGRALKKTRHAIFRTNHASWYARDLNRPFEDLPAKIPIEIEWDFSKTLEWMKANSDAVDVIPKELETAVRENHYYPNVRHEGEIIGFIKVGRGDVYVMDFDMNVHFQDHTAFIYDTYVNPDYRGKRIAPALITDVMRFLKQNGYDRLMCHIPLWNTASRSTYRKCAFEEIEHIRYFKLLGKKLFTKHPETL
jgi:ribosomal protein S18 acetylase RimI-like enzyme